MKDMPETGIPVLPAFGNADDNYLVWSDKMVDLLSNYRSCYTSAPLSYLVHEDEMGKVAALATYETLDQLNKSQCRRSTITNYSIKSMNY
jgi:hypothetical protein